MPAFKTATINDISMRYDVQGAANAPVVILHHPLATNLTFWDEAVAALSPTYRVVRFDARGHGKSEATVGRYAFETLAQDVVALMDHLGVKKAAYVGLSMGGWVGQYLGLLHADRFNSLTLVSTASRTAPEMQAAWRDRVTVARENGMISQVEPAMGRWLAASSRANRPDLVKRFSDMIATTPVEGYAGWCGAGELLDITAKLGAIKPPTRVIVGAEDPATTPASAEVIHKAIPGSDMIVIPGVAHMLSSEDPAAFHAAILPFLAKHAKA
jgi:3-oxoadipate enol-lactonase